MPIGFALTLLGATCVTAAGEAPDGQFLTLKEGQYVDIAGAGKQITGSPITVQAWFRTRGLRGHLYSCGFENGPASAPQAGYALYFDYGARVRFGVNHSEKGFTYDRWDNACTKQRYSDGRWHHVTGVFPADGKSRVKVYIDGKEVPDDGLIRVGKAQPALTKYIIKNIASRIGADSAGSPRRLWCFQGDIDELRIWNIALTAEQIAANYKRRLPTDTPGLVSQWSFDAGDNKLVDAVGKQRGTLKQAPAEVVAPMKHDYSKYPGGLTGWTGYDPDQIAHWTLKPAVRQRIGKRGLSDPAIARLGDGTLIVCANREGRADQPLAIFRSSDRGATWTQVRTQGKPPVVARPRLLVDGQTLSIADRGLRVRARSKDGGATWTAVAQGRGKSGRFGLDASDVVVNGRVLRAYRVRGDTPIPGTTPPRGLPRPKGDRTGDRAVLVEKSGPTDTADWGQPRTFLNYSEMDAHLLVLKDGRVLCTYANMHVPFGIMAILSSDGGKTWDKKHPIYLARSWGIKGGWPSSVQLDDGSIVTAYAVQAYRNEGKDTAVEAVRWELPPQSGDAATIAGIEGNVKMNAEPHDRGKYPAHLYGYSGGGRGRQQVAYLELEPAKRSIIGHRGLYKGALAKLKDGTLIATPSYNSTVKVYKSADNGETWQFVDYPAFGGKEMGAAVLRDGTLLNLHGAAVYRSTDGGRSWEIHRIGKPRSFGLVRNVVENPDGSLIMVVGRGTYYNRKAPPSRAWRLISRDAGRTWPEVTEIPSWKDPENMFDEAAMIRLPNGHLLAAGRVTDSHKPGGREAAYGYPAPYGSEDGDHMMLIESADDGLTWSKARDFLDYSRPHAELLLLKDGRILACYANYFLPFGIAAVISEDNGKTWSTDRPIYLAYATRCYTGWPVSVQLDDGSILTMYAMSAYAGKKDFTRAEAVRWRLPPKGKR